MLDPAKPVALGMTGLQLSQLSFGCATQGGLFRPVAETDAEDVFSLAWEAGLRYFDTAPWYGYGQSETRIGSFLKDKVSLRDENSFVLSTKVGRLLRDVLPHPSQLEPDGVTRSFDTPSSLNVIYDYSYDGFMRSFEESLKRLGLDRIDILYIHDPDVPGVSVKEVMAGGGRALIDLRDQGVVKAIGAGMNQWEMPLEFAQTGAFDVFLLAGRYTLLEQHSLPFMDYCAANGVSVVPCSVYNSGLLTKPKPGARYDYGPVPDEVLARALQLEVVCQRYDVPLRAAALQYPLAHPASVSVMTAARSVAQLKDSLEMFAVPIPNELWHDLDAEGLVTTHLPTAELEAYRV